MFKVGDLVVRSNRPEWGLGTITSIGHSELWAQREQRPYSKVTYERGPSDDYGTWNHDLCLLDDENEMVFDV